MNIYDHLRAAEASVANAEHALAAIDRKTRDLEEERKHAQTWLRRAQAEYVAVYDKVEEKRNEYRQALKQPDPSNTVEAA